MRISLPVAAVLAGCSGGEEETPEEPVESYACLHIAEGELVDFAQVRDEARSITVGRDPYRVNVVQDEVGYVAFETSAATDLVLLLDFVRAVPAVWNGEERVPLDPGEPNPNCEADLPEVLYFSVPSGSHWLEVGPIFQGNVWMMLDASAKQRSGIPPHLECGCQAAMQVAAIPCRTPTVAALEKSVRMAFGGA